MPHSEVGAGRAFGRQLRRRGPLGWLTRRLHSRAGLPFSNGPAMMLPQILSLRPEQRLLDLGGGTGALADLLQQIMNFERPAVCLDSSLGSLLAVDPGAESAARVRGLLGRLPFPAACFDVVLLGHVVAMVDEETLETGLREIRRVLKPGGACVIWDYGPRSSGYLNRWNQWLLTRLDGPRPYLRSTWQLTSTGSEAGFASIRVLNLGPFYFPPIPRVSILLRKSERPPRSSPRG